MAAAWAWRTVASMSDWPVSDAKSSSTRACTRPRSAPTTTGTSGLNVGGSWSVMAEPETAWATSSVRRAATASMTAASLVTSRAVAVNRSSFRTVRVAHTAVTAMGITMAANTTSTIDTTRRAVWRGAGGDAASATISTSVSFPISLLMAVGRCICRASYQ